MYVIVSSNCKVKKSENSFCPTLKFFNHGSNIVRGTAFSSLNIPYYERSARNEDFEIDGSIF